MANKPITMSQAFNGLTRFFTELEPSKITWGDLYRCDWSEKGLRQAVNLGAKLQENLSKAEAFYVHHNPNQLEEYCIQWFVKMTEEHLAILDLETEKIKRFIDQSKTLNSMVDGWELVQALDDMAQDDFPF